MSEHDEQCKVIEWAALQQGRYPDLRMLFAIPNGGHRHKVTAIKLRHEGVKAGVPDLFLAAPHGVWHGLFIEMKYDRNTTSEKQDWWLEELERQGYCAAVAWGFDEAKEIIESYLQQ